MIRLLKTALTACVALMCLFHAIQNVVNLQAGYSFVALMTSMDGHAAYPETFGFAITSPWINWLILWTIILTEFTAGLIAGKGTFDMWRARARNAIDFKAAKQMGILGSGLGVFIWFGYFTVIGGAFFQMWQTEAGSQPLRDAFQYVMMCGLVMLYLSIDEDQAATPNQS